MFGRAISRRMVLAGSAAVATIGTIGRAKATASITVIKAEDGRNVQVSIFPAVGPRRGVILFSHGALSAPDYYDLMTGPWTQAGFEVFAPLHTDSTDHPDHGKYPMAEGWKTRILDMRALSAWVNAPSYIAAGHSYGGLMALTLGGASAVIPPGVRGPLRDPRAKAVVAFSPPGPTPTLITKEGYATLAVPALIETGDKDVPFGATGATWQAHLVPYDVAPPGDKYALVLEGVDHYFGGIICNFSRPGPPMTAQLQTAVGLSIDFMNAYGLSGAEARHALDKALDQKTPFTLTRK